MSVRWSKNYETGFTAIDNQHHELFNKADEFVLAIMAEKEDEELEGLFTFLEGYVKSSFYEEEAMLIKTGWPDTDKHIAQHEYFRRRYAQLQRDFLFKGANEFLVRDIHQKVVAWMSGHIQNEDSQWAQWIRANHAEYNK
ncbi:MAG: hemerythrin family protein [Elusimicrobiaceae bacterium]|nr:hemerythrin family protein [Elusimicrobiaceae bacterium]